MTCGHAGPPPAERNLVSGNTGTGHHVTGYAAGIGILSGSSEHVVREVRHESDTVCTLVLDPRGTPLRFAPGQFAWLRLARSGGGPGE